METFVKADDWEVSDWVCVSKRKVKSFACVRGVGCGIVIEIRASEGQEWRRETVPVWRVIDLVHPCPSIFHHT
jgi:hypothetical protein